MELRRKKKKLLRMEKMMMKEMKKVGRGRRGWVGKAKAHRSRGREQLKTRSQAEGNYGLVVGLCPEPPIFPIDLFLALQMRKKKRRRMKAQCERELLKRRFDWVGTRGTVKNIAGPFGVGPRSLWHRQGLEQGQQEEGEVPFVQQPQLLFFPQDEADPKRQKTENGASA